jgi:hypothetical protein
MIRKALGTVNRMPKKAEPPTDLGPVKITVQFSGIENKQIDHYASLFFGNNEGNRQALIRFATKQYISKLVQDEEDKEVKAAI